VNVRRADRFDAELNHAVGQQQRLARLQLVGECGVVDGYPLLVARHDGRSKAKGLARRELDGTMLKRADTDLGARQVL
jgi:hypothetical protein